jgi:hypothetical protein
MTANANTSGTLARLARRLRIVAVAVFVLRVVGAEVVYLQGKRSVDTGLDDASMLGYDKASARQAGRMAAS